MVTNHRWLLTIIGFSYPMTDPWCCYIWCSMDPINIPPLCLYVSICTSTMDPSWAMESPMEMDDEKWVPPWIGNHHIVVECVIECVLIYCLILLMFWHQPPQSTL